MVSIDLPIWAQLKVKDRFGELTPVAPEKQANPLQYGDVLQFKLRHADVPVTMVWMDRLFPGNDTWVLIPLADCNAMIRNLSDVWFRGLGDKVAHCELAMALPRDLVQYCGVKVAQLSDVEMDTLLLVWGAMDEDEPDRQRWASARESPEYFHHLIGLVLKLEVLRRASGGKFLYKFRITK